MLSSGPARTLGLSNMNKHTVPVYFRSNKKTYLDDTTPLSRYPLELLCQQNAGVLLGELNTFEDFVYC